MWSVVAHCFTVGECRNGDIEQLAGFDFSMVPYSKICRLTLSNGSLETSTIVPTVINHFFGVSSHSPYDRQEDLQNETQKFNSRS